MKSELLLMAGYHAWACETLFRALLNLPEDDYRRDCGLFFGSIHGTLNHLLVADRVWFARIRGERYEVAGLDAELEHDRVRLEQALLEQAACWLPWIEAAEGAQLARALDYTNLAGTTFSNPISAVLLHVFNHGTHHRGQISAALSGAGQRAPEMDLIFYLRGVGGALPAV